MEKTNSKIGPGFLALSILVIIFWEYVFYRISLRSGMQGVFLHEIRFTFFLRLVQSLFIFICAVLFSDPQSIGLGRAKFKNGVIKGLAWSSVFGAMALSSIFILSLSGVKVLGFFRIDHVRTNSEIFWFFAAAGIAGPVAEELFFRGIVFGYLRRRGFAIAAISSTLIFVLAHSISGIPYTQVIGGLVFCWFYERTGSLVTPIIIHTLGNMAMFTLGLLPRFI